LAELKRLDGSDKIESYATSWAANVNLVKSYAEDHPEEKIPELQNLPFRFWMQSIEYPWRLKTKLDYEFRMNRVRGEALIQVYEKVLGAAMQYQNNSKGNPPTSFEQLRPFCSSEFMDLLTQNYQFQPAQTIPASALQKDSVINGDWVISRKLIVNESPHIDSDQAKIFSIVPVRKSSGQLNYETAWN
jgi:hypothetical protein